MERLFFALLFLAQITACENGKELSDAYGNFEAEDVLISAEGNGKLMKLDIEEGVSLKEGQIVGLVDTMQIYLQKVQLEARLRALDQKLQDAEPDILVLQKQLENFVREQARLEKLVANNAATTQQLDDINGQVKVVQQQMQAARDKVSLANQSILSEADPIRAQIRLLDDQLDKCRVVNPVSGTVLLKLANQGEVVSMGKPLYKIAPLNPLTLRVYVSGAQIEALSLGQEVEVLVDRQEGQLKAFTGRVSWISDEAEFTPKTIQTKEERINLVYAVKIKVENDGSLKIGMPGEANWSSTHSQAQTSVD